MTLTAILLTTGVIAAALIVLQVVGWLIDRHVNPPSYCFDCRRGHHDHDIESGTCRRTDCGCKA